MTTEQIIQAIFGFIFIAQLWQMNQKLSALGVSRDYSDRETDKLRDKSHEHSNVLQQHEGRITSLERDNNYN